MCLGRTPATWAWRMQSCMSEPAGMDSGARMWNLTWGLSGFENSGGPVLDRQQQALMSALERYTHAYIYARV